eukprot:jgi/Mesvir1/29631/Mv21482-RA.2
MASCTGPPRLSICSADISCSPNPLKLPDRRHSSSFTPVDRSVAAESANSLDNGRQAAAGLPEMPRRRLEVFFPQRPSGEEQIPLESFSSANGAGNPRGQVFHDRRADGLASPAAPALVDAGNQRASSPHPTDDGRALSPNYPVNGGGQQRTARPTSPRRRDFRFRGITPHHGRWQARIKDARKDIHLGYYDTDVEAAQAYDKAAIKLRGREALTNFSLDSYNLAEIEAADSPQNYKASPPITYKPSASPGASPQGPPARVARATPDTRTGSPSCLGRGPHGSTYPLSDGRDHAACQGDELGPPAAPLRLPPAQETYPGGSGRLAGGDARDRPEAIGGGVAGAVRAGHGGVGVGHFPPSPTHQGADASNWFLTLSDPATLRLRGQYRCGKCRMPKKGHICPAEGGTPGTPPPAMSAHDPAPDAPGRGVKREELARVHSSTSLGGHGGSNVPHGAHQGGVAGASHDYSGTRGDTMGGGSARYPASGVDSGSLSGATRGGARGGGEEEHSAAPATPAPPSFQGGILGCGEAIKENVLAFAPSLAGGPGARHTPPPSSLAAGNTCATASMMEDKPVVGGPPRKRLRMAGYYPSCPDGSDMAAAGAGGGKDSAGATAYGYAPRAPLSQVQGSAGPRLPVDTVHAPGGTYDSGANFSKGNNGSVSGGGGRGDTGCGRASPALHQYVADGRRRPPTSGMPPRGASPLHVLPDDEKDEQGEEGTPADRGAPRGPSPAWRHVALSPSSGAASTPHGSHTYNASTGFSPVGARVSSAGKPTGGSSHHKLQHQVVGKDGARAKEDHREDGRDKLLRSRGADGRASTEGPPAVYPSAAPMDRKAAAKAAVRAATSDAGAKGFRFKGDVPGGGADRMLGGLASSYGPPAREDRYLAGGRQGVTVARVTSASDRDGEGAYPPLSSKVGARCDGGPQGPDYGHEDAGRGGGGGSAKRVKLKSLSSLGSPWESPGTPSGGGLHAALPFGKSPLRSDGYSGPRAGGDVVGGSSGRKQGGGGSREYEEDAGGARSGSSGGPLMAARPKSNSRYRGTTRHHGRWQARIKDNRKDIHLGYFDTEEEAAREYDRAALKYRGANAVTNFPPSDYGYDGRLMGQGAGRAPSPGGSGRLVSPRHVPSVGKDGTPGSVGGTSSDDDDGLTAICRNVKRSKRSHRSTYGSGGVGGNAGGPPATSPFVAGASGGVRPMPVLAEELPAKRAASHGRCPNACTLLIVSRPPFFTTLR